MLKLASLVLVLAACSGASTGSTCPTADRPTYAGFGRPFFATYCDGCHARGAAERHGAPADEVFDTEADVAARAADIDEVAAIGPRARNTDMPDLDGPVRAAPSDAERARLGQFLACMTR